MLCVVAPHPLSSGSPEGGCPPRYLTIHARGDEALSRAAPRMVPRPEDLWRLQRAFCQCHSRWSAKEHQRRRLSADKGAVINPGRCRLIHHRRMDFGSQARPWGAIHKRCEARPVGACYHVVLCVSSAAASHGGRYSRLSQGVFTRVLVQRVLVTTDLPSWALRTYTTHRGYPIGPAELRARSDYLQTANPLLSVLTYSLSPALSHPTYSGAIR